MFSRSIRRAKYDFALKGVHSGEVYSSHNFRRGTNLVCTLPFPFGTIFHPFPRKEELPRGISITARSRDSSLRARARVYVRVCVSRSESTSARRFPFLGRASSKFDDPIDRAEINHV